MANWTWLGMSLETAVFLIFSALMWRIISRADTRRQAGAADQANPASEEARGVPVLSGRCR